MQSQRKKCRHKRKKKRLVASAYSIRRKKYQGFITVMTCRDCGAVLKSNNLPEEVDFGIMGKAV